MRIPPLLTFGLISGLTLGCQRDEPLPTPEPPVPVTTTAATAAAPPETEPSPANTPEALPAEGIACGAPDAEVTCRRFPSVSAAMAAVMKTDPLVLAIGEAHAQKGTEGIDSSTKRFTEQILPLLKGNASDVVIELTVGQAKCQKAVKETETATKEVTKNQASSNQNEFLTLGNRAKELEIRPHVLRPSCADFDRVAKAKTTPDKVVEMLTLIARHSDELLKRILQRNAKDKREALVLAYGGALHNDLSPAAGKEAWSFGPSMAEATGERFVELDLFVPEFIKDTDSWKAMPWHPHYDRDATPEGAVTLFSTGPRSYVLIFPKTPR